MTKKDSALYIRRKSRFGVFCSIVFTYYKTKLYVFSRIYTLEMTLFFSSHVSIFQITLKVFLKKGCVLLYFFVMWSFFR